MSDRIPFELLEEIIKWLPVKSLLQFRSVSKPWKSLIDSSEFIAAHSLRHNQPQRLLLRYKNQIGTRTNYVSFFDDDTFPQNKFAPNLPISVNRLRYSVIIGISHGLLCFYGSCLHRGDFRITYKLHMAIVWNPSIRKSIAIEVPDASYASIVGFGVCPVTSDPKILKIKQENTTPSNFWKVEVYTLSSNKWRSLSLDCNLPSKSIKATRSQVSIDEFIYWVASERISRDDGEVSTCHKLIISFDVTNEKFTPVALPDSLARDPDATLSIRKLRESLAVLAYSINAEKAGCCDVWMMDGGVKKSCIKLFTIKALDALAKPVLTFRTSGEAIIEMDDDCEDFFGATVASLAVYEPKSENIKSLGIDGKSCSFLVRSYNETLLLLGQSNCSSD